jgi:hypothetical protein
MTFTGLVRVVHVGVKYLSLLGIPLSLIHLGQLAVLLGLADYVLDTFFNSLRADICIEGLVKLYLLGKLSKIISVSHLLCADVKGATM